MMSATPSTAPDSLDASFVIVDSADSKQKQQQFPSQVAHILPTLQTTD